MSNITIIKSKLNRGLALTHQESLELYKYIRALEQHPKVGRWVEENINEWTRKVFCSECGCPPPFEYVSNGDVYSASGYGVINKTKFCPMCGAKMEVKEV